MKKYSDEWWDTLQLINKPLIERRDKILNSWFLYYCTFSHKELDDIFNALNAIDDIFEDMHELE